MRSIKLAAVFALLLPLNACRGTQQPTLDHPGPIAYQQHAATIHDPFPQKDMGPEVVGGRPLEYDAPYSETRRVQSDRWIRSPWNPANWFGSRY